MAVASRQFHPKEAVRQLKMRSKWEASRTSGRRSVYSQKCYVVPMTLRFVLLTMVPGVVLTFLLGRMARVYIIQQQQQQQAVAFIPGIHKRTYNSLPSPLLGASLNLPLATQYSSKHFRTRGTASESFLSREYNKNTSLSPIKETQAHGNLDRVVSRQYFSTDWSANAQKHLQRYLSSETGVVNLLNKLLATSSSTVLSYHCHRVGSHHGISCVGIASHGHIVLHTSPNRLSLDVYGIDLDEEIAATILGKPLSVVSPPTTGSVMNDAVAQLSHDWKANKSRRAANSAFVHPALLAHEDPETVLLVGGSALTVQSILQHSTLDRLILVDMDPQWNDDCVIPLASSPRNEDDALYHCADHPRVELYQEPALQWLVNASMTTMRHEIDVILVEEPSVFAEDRESTTDAMAHVLNDKGIVVMNVPMKTRKDKTNKLAWADSFVALGDVFDIIREYSEGDSNFLIVFLDEEVSLGRWFANEAEVNLAIRERIVSPLEYMDASNMQSYQFPSRLAEDDFCHVRPEDATCREGHGLNPERVSLPITSFEVKLSTVPNGGRGIYVKQPAPAGSYMLVDECVHGMYIPDPTIHIMEEILDTDSSSNIPEAEWKTLLSYADGYGYSAEDFGESAYDVDPGIGTFVNHGCNGTANVGAPSLQHLTEESFLALQEAGAVDVRLQLRLIKYNPALDRTVRSHGCAENVALRDIEQGEEIFNNYMSFVADDDLEEYAASLRAECSGKAYGQVLEYEMTAHGGVGGSRLLFSGHGEEDDGGTNSSRRIPPVLPLNATNGESCIPCSIFS